MRKTMGLLIAVAGLGLGANSAQAWLGDSVQELTQRYGPQKAVEKTTGDLPTQPGQYVELKEVSSTNSIWMAAPKNGHYLELIERRTRYLFEKDGLNIAAYVGNDDEKYGGVDFAGKSAREVIEGPVHWEKNASGDKVGHAVPLAPELVASVLAANKGSSSWEADWQAGKPSGRFFRRTEDKTRLAIGYGPSEKEFYRLEVKMVDDSAAAE